MKSILLFLMGSTVIFGQPLSFGVKGGLPLTDFIDTFSGGGASVKSATNRYIVGPTVELRLPAGFGVEFDALYRHFNYNSTASAIDVLTSLRTTADAWEFPLLLKKRFAHGPIRPFLDAGVNFNKITGLSQTVSTLVFPSRTTVTNNSSPNELKNDSTAGITIGGGLELHALLLKITPEIRFTRWGAKSFNSVIPAAGSLSSNQNQAEFLLGITF